METAAALRLAASVLDLSTMSGSTSLLLPSRTNTMPWEIWSGSAKGLGIMGYRCRRLPTNNSPANFAQLTGFNP